MHREHTSSCWMVERQAFGGNYWDSIVFGPFPSREEAERFADGPHGGHPYDASRPVPVEPDYDVPLRLRARSNVLGSDPR